MAAIVGTALGVAAGFFGGWLDRVIARLVDMMIAFPELLLAIIISAALGGGFWTMARNAETLTNAKQAFERLVGERGQIELAHRIAPQLVIADNSCRSFHTLAQSIKMGW